MSNFFNSKIRISGFIFSLISACAIIGCSVMLSLGDKMTVNINQNLHREIASNQSNNINNRLDTNIQKSNNSRVQQESFQWTTKDVDFISLGVLEAKRNKDNFWRTIDKKSTERDGKNVGYFFILKAGGEIFLNHGKHPDTEFRINLSKIKASDVLEGIDPSRDTEINLSWKIEPSDDPPPSYYSATIDKDNKYLIITDNTPEDPFNSGFNENLILSLYVSTTSNDTPVLLTPRKYIYIRGEKEQFNFKTNGVDLIPLNALEAKTQEGNWRLITKESIDKGIDSGYQFYLSDASKGPQYFNLYHSFHPDTSFRINLAKINASDILEGVNQSRNNDLHLEWSVKPSDYNVYNCTKEGDYLVINDSTPDKPYDNSPTGYFTEFWITLKVTDNTIPHDLGNSISRGFKIGGQELKYRLKNNNLLSINDLIFASETTDPKDLKPVDTKPGYEFYSSYYSYENKLTLNTSAYKDKYFKIDFSKLKATDIIEGAKNDNFELTWMLDNKELPSNILEFVYDDTHPWPSNLSLLVVDKNLTNPQPNNYPIPIKFEKIAYGVSIPNNKSVIENDTLTISDFEINIAGVNDTDLANAKYQWESLNQTNNQWEPIKGQTNKTLNINNVSIQDWNNKKIRLVIKVNSKTLTSNPCSINVNEAPKINISVSITQQNECFDGDSLTITSTINTSTNVDQTKFSYRWVDENDNELTPSQTGKDFKVNPVDMTWDGRKVKLIVTYEGNEYPSINTVTITVKPKISISLDNLIKVTEGDTLKIIPKVEISSKIDSSLLSYQWFDVTDASNPTPIPNEDATNQTLLKNQIDLSWDKKQVKLIATYKAIEYPSTNIATIIVTPKENATPPPEPDPIPPLPEPVPPESTPPITPPINPPVEPQPPTTPSLPSNVAQIGVGSSNYGFTYDKNGNIISNQHWQGSYLSSVQKARNLISEIDNKLLNPNLSPNEINLLQIQKEICNKMILASNLVISGSVLVGLFGIIFIASIIVMIEFSKFWM